ncbi:MAG TPA: response regulator transcription factor [Candidatus Acidoferrum sp.]|nr:response regulator transcription factor [Candidatus Acidoferrum sp.]
MGAVAKNLIPQLVPAPAQPTLGPLMPVNSATASQTIGLKEAQQLSKFVPVLVLVPATPSESRSVRAAGTRDIVPIEDPGTALLLQFLQNAMSQVKAKKIEGGLSFGDAKVDFSAMEATRKGRPVALTPLEFKTLKYLAQNERRVISREELLNEVWGYQNYPCTRTVDNHILKLRQKFEKDPACPLHFQTVHGAGYKFLP